jgi:hypothetical protein
MITPNYKTKQLQTSSLFAVQDLLKVNRNASMELIFSDTLAHGAGAANTTSHQLEEIICVVGTAPFLVSDDFASRVHLWLLDQLSISTHTMLAVCLGEGISNESSLMQTSKSNELPAVTEFSQSVNVGLLLITWHGSLPVERRRQVVSELLLWPHGMYTIGKLLGLCVIWQFALHPDGIGIWCESNGSVDGTLASALVPVITFSGPWSLPVKENILTSQLFGNGPRVLVALALGSSLVLAEQAGLVGEGSSVDDIGNGLVEETEIGILDPVVLDGLEGITELASLLGSNHKVIESLDIAVGASEDESVVTRIDGGGDEGGGLGVGTSNGKEISAHDISLSTNSHKSVDVFLNWHENLSGHVSALFCAWCLILNVDTGSTLFDEHLGELHHGSDTTVSSVCVGNDGTEEIGVGDLATLALWGAEALFTLLAVVEELGEPKMLDLVWDSGLSIMLVRGFS